VDLGLSEKLAPVLEQVRAFISAQILPVEGEYISEIEVGDPFDLTDRQYQILNELKTPCTRSGLVEFFSHR
jgi:acyl-CoA dehydrogenase